MHERLAVMQGLLLAALTQAMAHNPVPADGAQLSSAAYGALHAGALACDLASDGLQVLGAAGYVASSAQAQGLCDARQLQGLAGGAAWQRQCLLAQGG